MRHSHPLCHNVLRLQLSLVLGIAGSVGCGVDEAGETAVDPEAVTGSEQALIPGAAVTQTSRLITIPAGGTLVDQQLNCPAGSVVVGGGHLSSEYTRVYSSAPNFNGWLISIQNLSNTKSYTLTQVVQCLSGTRATSGLVAPTTVTIAKGGFGCAPLATCPAGKLMTGGGYYAPSSFRASTNRQEWTNSWEVCGTNANSGSSITVEVYPLCLSGVTGSVTVHTVNGPSVNPGESVRVDSNPCASGLLLGSGGYFSSLRALYARGSTRSFQDATRWSGTFYNPSSTAGRPNVRTNCLELWQ
jgi:hypothetical protein